MAKPAVRTAVGVLIGHGLATIGQASLRHLVQYPGRGFLAINRQVEGDRIGSFFGIVVGLPKVLAVNSLIQRFCLPH